ncbi:DUF2877 domain-containing protein [Clostridium sp. Mt-5]|uniref:DUF2877 domain-containing protein n=2 Tax=Clostridium moutaii TaxID=3240932 RepID=A0ABV4BW76_9CLOT
MPPMSVSLDNQKPIDFIDIGIRKNLKFMFDPKIIYNYEKNIFIQLCDIKTWSSKIPMECINCTEKEILENLGVLESALSAYGRFYGMGPLISIISGEFPELKLKQFGTYSHNRAFEFIKYRFINFIGDLLKGDVEQIAEKTGNIIGFGPGLTPAIDDFISGLMVSFVYLGRYYNFNISQIYSLNRKIIKLGLNKTTRVSRERVENNYMKKLHLYVNGDEIFEEIPSNSTLLWFLREKLGLTGEL